MDYNRRKKLSDLRSRNFRRDTTPLDDYEEYEMGDDEWVDSADEVDQLRYAKPVVSLNGPELSSQATSDVDNEQTRAGKVFGFIRGKVDEATDDFRMRQKAKQNAYEKYLEQKPSMLQAQYENKYAKKLERQFNTSGDDRWKDFFSEVSGGMSKVSNMLGGAKSPEQVMGFRGTVFGDLPGAGSYGNQNTSNFQDNIRGALSGNTMASPQPQPQYMQPQPDDSKYGKPGVVGSQVPKYQSWPKNAKPGTTYVRVQDIDQWGKKRSYMRKARVPPEQMPQIPGQVPEQPQVGMVEPQPQQNLVSGDINPQAFQALLEGLQNNRKTVNPSVLNQNQNQNSMDFQNKINAYIGDQRKQNPSVFAYRSGKILNGRNLKIAAYLE